MTAPAAPPTGRRPSFGTATMVVAFLFLAPPLFLLAPLALLLLFSRPATLREWVWVALAVAGTAMTLADLGQAGLPARLMAAGSLMAAAVFVLLTSAPRPTPPTPAEEQRPRFLFPQVLGSVGAGVVGVLIWSRRAGIRLADLDGVVAADFASAMRLVFQQAPADQLEAGLQLAATMARLFPAMIALQAIVGLLLAWAWYHRIARAPAPPAPTSLAAFRFNDHLIWGAIFTIGLVLLPLGAAIERLGLNLIVVWAGIYGARGGAVVATAATRWPLPGKILLVVLAFLASPIAISSTVALGLADTWLDFRNRMVPPGGGGNANGTDSP